MHVQKGPENYLCMGHAMYFFTPMTDWIDKNDSSRFRSDFGQGWRATKKARLGCKRVMRVLECKKYFSL